MVDQILTNSERGVALAERHVFEAEADISRQKRLIGELHNEGHTTVGAQILLRLLKRELDGYRTALRLRRALKIRKALS